MNKKLLIVCLIVLAVLFLAGLGTGFVLNTGKKPDPAAFSPDDWPWLKAMGSLLPASGTPLDLARLKPRGCRRSGDAFLLDENSASCEIQIRPMGSADPEDYQQTDLQLQGPDTRVEVVYEPTGEDLEASEKIWSTGDDPIRLVVFEQGGRLTLACLNCGAGGGRTVRVRFE